MFSSPLFRKVKQKFDSAATEPAGKQYTNNGTAAQAEEHGEDTLRTEHLYQTHTESDRYPTDLVPAPTGSVVPAPTGGVLPHPPEYGHMAWNRSPFLGPHHAGVDPRGSFYLPYAPPPVPQEQYSHLANHPIIIQNQTRATAEAQQQVENNLPRKKRPFYFSFAESLWSSRINRTLVYIASGFIVFVTWEWWQHRRRVELLRMKVDSSAILRFQRLITGMLSKGGDF